MAVLLALNREGLVVCPECFTVSLFDSQDEGACSACRAPEGAATGQHGPPASQEASSAYAKAEERASQVERPPESLVVTAMDAMPWRGVDFHHFLSATEGATGAELEYFLKVRGIDVEHDG
uniref:Uncharacterized protein n=1 Tax=Pinguiococcus pyrenoidosus TaxID=172671 RepID=A0A7R9YFU3_9STRA|mmetsp:Transcript_910/g.3784  ORF Transcript_910/g.3784 Transcript_910/m.3784 type:complete len:121 (+) Transcript_910:117-479(+)